MRVHNVVPMLVPLALMVGQSPAAGDGNWPREMDTDSIHLVVYQPQVDAGRAIELMPVPR